MRINDPDFGQLKSAKQEQILWSQLVETELQAAQLENKINNQCLPNLLLYHARVKDHIKDINVVFLTEATKVKIFYHTMRDYTCNIESKLHVTFCPSRVSMKILS